MKGAHYAVDTYKWHHRGHPHLKRDNNVIFTPRLRKDVIPPVLIISNSKITSKNCWITGRYKLLLLSSGDFKPKANSSQTINYK